ncbi:MAG: sugar kinase [Chloroflexi bacterium]|nr:sugar kinase [Chloroflexota bacterium]
MGILVVGSVALDSVATPFGQVERALGGSAVYFSLAARHYRTVRLVGVVGDDFPEEYVRLLRESAVDLRGLQSVPGQTFHWAGRYDHDLNVAHTLDTRLNVFAGFHPVLPDSYRASEFVFLANIDPTLQLDVLRQVERPLLTVVDTMNFWIAGKRDALTEVIRQTDVVLMNEAELRQYAGTDRLLAGARHVLSLGPRALVVKKGENGAALFADGVYFVAPAYPLEEVRDPTGAGDSFAGGFVGYLARTGDVTDAALRRAVIHGSVAASFTVEDFSVRRLVRVTRDEVGRRFQDMRQFTWFEPD